MLCAVSPSMSSRRTNRRSTARRKASVSVVTSCSGNGTKVPSARNPPSVTHLMVFVGGAALPDLPVDGESGGPWVMGEGEAAHLMIPIR